MSVDFTNFARVSRMLPQVDQEGDEAEMRASRYGEQLVIPVVRKQHALVEEGSYYIANNNSQTGILSSPAGSATRLRTPGMQRPARTMSGPRRRNQRSASSSLAGS